MKKTLAVELMIAAMNAEMEKSINEGFDPIEIHNHYDLDAPCQAGNDLVDSRLTSKCKRLRREARGW